ncbi:MAG: phosphoglucosamine mutase [Christensenellales bacterium]|jgi:phosphoglucosamine mutase
MGKLFGTDGVRGIANTELSCDIVFKLGQAGTYALTSAIKRPRILIGRDTRLSGEMLESALVAGVCSVGGEAVVCGVLPTPAIAYLTRHYSMDAGIVISASHNPVEYNGIKLFNTSGHKLADAIEDYIEEVIEKGLDECGVKLPSGEGVGRRVRIKNASREYVDFLCGTTETHLGGMKVVLDCANGAASNVAEDVFARLGATIYPIYNNPDGKNINDNCGSTSPQRLQQLVTELGADVGLAFDGDADRLIAVDEHGMIVDGDKIMAICALDMKENNQLKNNTLVATIMSNLGLIKCMEKAGINVIQTQVGDRYVLERMIQDGCNLGGEQSGHIIFLDKNTTGDGILTGVHLLSVMAKKKTKLSVMSKQLKIYPQVLINARVPNSAKQKYQDDEVIQKRIKEIEELFEGNGRVVIRPSGTEPVIRVMIEAPDKQLIDKSAWELAKLIESRLK